MPSKLVIGCPPGVGEAWWVNSKLKGLKEVRGAEELTVCVFGGSFNRADETHRRFPWVDEVVYERFSMHPQNIISREGTYEYLPTQANFRCPSGRHLDFLMIPNQHLEMGKRIDEWMADVPSCNDTLGEHFELTEGDRKVAAEIINRFRQPFVLLYLGHLPGNTRAGHNRGPIWTPDDWIKLIEEIHAQWGLHFVVVGHPLHDLTYYSMMIEPKLVGGGIDYVHNAIGQTVSVPEVYALAKKAEFFVSYQCGLGIGAVYLGVPTIMWWRPRGNSIAPDKQISFYEAMSHCWAPFPALQNGTYLPYIYGREKPLAILDDIANRGWVDKNPRSMTIDGGWYNEKYFDAGARSVDGHGYHQYGEWEGSTVILTATKIALDLPNGSTLLDVGCARGTWVREASKLGFLASGIDFSEWAINNPVEGVSDRWIKYGDASDIGFTDRSFDIVICLDTLEHIYEEDVDAVLREIFRVADRFVLLNIGVNERFQTRRIFDKNEDVTAMGEEDRIMFTKGHVTNLPEDEWIDRIEKIAPLFTNRPDLWKAIASEVHAEEEREFQADGDMEEMRTYLENWKAVLVYARA